MNLEIKKENILYMDVINRSITLRLKTADVDTLHFVYSNELVCQNMTSEFIQKFDLVQTDRHNQFIPRKIEGLNV